MKTECIDKGKGKVILLVHGLFGALSNWKTVINELSKNYRVIVPRLPITEVDPSKASISGLSEFVRNFISSKKLKNISIIGNSLGGHLALDYVIHSQRNVNNLILTGSSGLFENSFGGSFPKRGDYNYINERVNYTFYNPKILSKKYIKEVYDTLNDNDKCLNIIKLARSAQRNNMSELLYKIKSPTLLVWGLNDTITPPSVAHEFNRLIKNSKIKFIDSCCHAPMMEHPKLFNRYIIDFLK
ncbi:MAG: alpha/beta hydrolase [Flammeovirgaceae bacterium]|nr:alpha/beta hydrolase [Flammeovirgaceae bacterium]|tara:strand:- start:2850 stop:3575 length:726 start_codon:yes stop_codon:yes gene_type:complete